MFWAMFNVWFILHWNECGFHSMNYETKSMHGRIFKLVFNHAKNEIGIVQMSRNVKESGRFGRFFFTLE